MISTIREYIESKFEQLNAGRSSTARVRLIENDLILSQISASQADINYQLYITGIEDRSEYEASNFQSVSVRLDFVFIVANKDYTIYQEKFDNFVYMLFKLIKQDMSGVMWEGSENSGAALHEITAMAITDANRFEDSYYKPAIEFTVLASDEMTTAIYGTENSLV